jgi:hypothetical protein
VPHDRPAASQVVRNTVQVADVRAPVAEPSGTFARPGFPATAWVRILVQVLDLVIASGDDTPPVQADLLDLVVTTSDIEAELWALTGDGQILGNLLFNVSHLLDEGNAVSLLLLLAQLALLYRACVTGGVRGVARLGDSRPGPVGAPPSSRPRRACARPPGVRGTKRGPTRR